LLKCIEKNGRAGFASKIGGVSEKKSEKTEKTLEIRAPTC